MSATDAEGYLNELNKKMQPVARKVHDSLVSMGCTSYVKTIYVGYDIGGEMVAALYGHADHVEVALAVAEDHPDARLLDASHLTWRTLPLALNLKNVSEVSECQALLQEACDRVREQTHDVHRDNDFFVSRKRRGVPNDS
jgi:hypothetical protein